jgi:hypothetical protein
MVSFSFVGAGATGLEIFAGTGAGAFALLASFFFGSAWAELRDDGAAALTVLRAVAVLPAAGVFVVVFVAIKKF